MTLIDNNIDYVDEEVRQSMMSLLQSKVLGDDIRLFLIREFMKQYPVGVSLNDRGRGYPYLGESITKRVINGETISLTRFSNQKYMIDYLGYIRECIDRKLRI